jgi:hypothetical protein
MKISESLRPSALPDCPPQASSRLAYCRKVRMTHCCELFDVPGGRITCVLTFRV